MDVRLYGEDPHEIFLIHGGPGARGSMRPLAEMLVVDDACGHSRYGVVEAIQSQHDVESLVTELHGQIKQYAASHRATLIGHSWGAWLAIVHAARYPESVRRIILIGTAPFETKHADTILRRRMERLDADAGNELRMAIAAAESHATSRNRHAGREASDTALRQIARLTTLSDNVDLIPYDNDMPFDSAAYEKVWPAARNMRDKGEWHEILREIKCPVTVIHGHNDPHPVEGVTEPLARAGIAFDLHILQRCGHTPFLERHAAQELKRIILETTDRI